MEFINNLDDVLEKWSLLKHPFYQAWNNGILNKNTLNVYAQEYYHHVAAFPRYISQLLPLEVGVCYRTAQSGLILLILTCKTG